MLELLDLVFKCVNVVVSVRELGKEGVDLIVRVDRDGFELERGVLELLVEWVAIGRLVMISVVAGSLEREALSSVGASAR